MITELLAELRTAVSKAHGLSDEAKSELLGHVTAMESCADDTPPPAANGTTPDGEKDLLHHPVQGLVNSIEQFEVSHPDITALINRIALALGNMGI